MNDTPVGRSQSPLARRRWLLVVGALLVVLLGAWVLTRRGAPAAGAETTGAAGSDAGSAERKEGVDSIVILDSTSLRLAAIEVGVAASSGAVGLIANGTVAYDANRVAIVAPRAEGRVTAVRADLGQSIRTGSVLAILESPEVGQIRGDVERTQAMLDVAKQTYEREKSLFDQQVTSQRELLEAQAAYRSAQAEYNAARARMRALGASGDTSATAGGFYTLVSPVSGTVVERNATPGLIAGPGTSLFTVADLHHLWVTVDVYESEFRRVRTGAAATVVTRAMPGETFRGHVTYAGGIVDPETRTLKVRVEVENPGRNLRPGMYAEVRIEAPPLVSAGTEGGESVVLPQLAVQDLNGKTMVFVPAGAAGRFVTRPVLLGASIGGGLVTIARGLELGDSVVVKGAFQLKSELLKASFGEREK